MTVQTSFWARRRAAVEAEAEADIRAQMATEDAARAAECETKDDTELLAEMGLPDPETMQPGDDFSAFMAREVPKHLKNKALRTLWRSNPVLACLDGLNDYDEDFTIGATGNGPIKTAYQVGKGMLAHIEEMQRQQELAEAPKIEVTDLDEDEGVPEKDVAESIDAEMPMAADYTIEVEDVSDPAPSRMRFRFEEASV